MIALTAAVVALGSTAKASIGDLEMPLTPEAQFAPEVILAQARPPSGFNSNWYISPAGCAYSKAGSMWILIQNPHHLGLPNADPSCPNTL
ncbi:hypothetical protein ACS3SW_02320 [Roseobacteraceae bacterium S113]